MSWNEIAALIKDILIAIAAVSTAWTARKGLNTWREELSGKSKFKVGIELLRTKITLQDEVEKAISSRKEVLFDPLLSQLIARLNEVDDETKYLVPIDLEVELFSKIEQIQNDFDRLGVEAMVFWPSFDTTKINDVKTKIDGIRTEIRLDLWGHVNEDGEFQNISKFKLTDERLLYLEKGFLESAKALDNEIRRVMEQ